MDAGADERAQDVKTPRLTRGLVAATVVALLTVAAVVVLTGVVARGWWRGTGGSYAPKRMVVRTSITPSRSLFGQLVPAEADVVLDPRVVAPASIELTP